MPCPSKRHNKGGRPLRGLKTREVGWSSKSEGMKRVMGGQGGRKKGKRGRRKAVGIKDIATGGEVEHQKEAKLTPSCLKTSTMGSSGLSSRTVISTPALRNDNSRSLGMRRSIVKAVETWKMIGSGVKRTRVPFFLDLSAVFFKSLTGAPVSNSMSNRLPFRQTDTSRRELNALTTDKPTP